MEIKQENGRTICNYSIKEQEDVSTMVAITYMGDLQDFLKINYVADEVSFINHKLSKVRQAITELKPIVSFGDEPYYEEHMESMESEVIKTKEGIRNLYWWAVRYESFLNDRLQEINKPEQNEPAIIEEVLLHRDGPREFPRRGPTNRPRGTVVLKRQRQAATMKAVRCRLRSGGPYRRRTHV